MAANRPPGVAPRVDERERLLVEAAQQDPAKFGDLYETHFDRIYSFIAHRIRDRATVEDLTSEVFQKALANLKNYEWRGVPFGAWLLKIALNAINDECKRDSRQARASDEQLEAGTEPDLDVIEYRARLFQIVRQLPTDQRHVIFARFVEQKSIREIAQHLGRSEGAIKQLQFRAMQSLRTQVEGRHA